MPVDDEVMTASVSSRAPEGHRRVRFRGDGRALWRGLVCFASTSCDVGAVSIGSDDLACELPAACGEAPEEVPLCGDQEMGFYSCGMGMTEKCEWVLVCSSEQCESQECGLPPMVPLDCTEGVMSRAVCSRNGGQCGWSVVACSASM